MDEELDRNWQCAPSAQKAKCILGSIKRSSGETLPAVLHPDLGSSVQERHGPVVGAGLEEGHKNAGTPLL